jgi:hypothetical protein
MSLSSVGAVSDLVLTDAQKNFFKTFGYLSFPGLMAQDAGEIIAGFERVFSSVGGGHFGKPHDGKSRSCIVPFIDRDAYLSSLLDDSRVHGILASLLGDDFNYMGSDGNYYTGNTPWHSDSGFSPRRLHVKIAFYLDPVDANSGCLRVIPGSHRVGEPFAQDVHAHYGNSEQYWGVAGANMPCVPLPTKPGDLVLFNHDLKHASYHGATNRRMFTINCCQRYGEQDINTLRQDIGGFSRFWIDRVYGQAMLSTATPQRKRHLEQVLANDSHLAALSAKARQTMSEPSRG